MEYAFSSHTDAGRIRQNNEDCVAFDEATCLAVLADGMGGYNAGEIASGMATAFIKTELSRWLAQAANQAQPGELRRALEICVDNANRAIFNASSFNSHYAGMGTTLVVAVFQGSTLTLAHIGDSRCYRMRHGELVQITKDHSLLQEQIDAGLITAQQAALSPHKNLVTRALGVEATALLDLSEYPVEPGDLYLLCSDGLSDMVNDAAIAKILQNAPALPQLASELVALANESGGRDNISVLLVRASDTPEKPGMLSRWLKKQPKGYVNN